MSALIGLAVVALLLVLLHRPLGDFMARTYSSTKDLRVERVGDAAAQRGQDRRERHGDRSTPRRTSGCAC